MERRRARLAAELNRELPGTLQEGEERTLLLPKSAAEVAVALRLARRFDVPLHVPGSTPREEAVVLDLRRLSEVLAVDDTSHTVHVEAGMSVAVLEVELRRRELTLGLSSSLPEISVGAWLARGAPGARAKADDPVDQLVSGLEAVLADGRKLEVRPAPRRAVGPDLVAAFVGARGRLGVIIGAHLVARPRAPQEDLVWRFPRPGDAEAALAWIRGRGCRPAHAGVSERDGEVLLRVRLEGPDTLRRVRGTVARREAAARGGVEVESRTSPAPRSNIDAPPPAPIVQALGKRLDPENVLG